MEFTSVAILITEDCNARCKMCCDCRGIVRGKTLSDEEITLILNEIRNTSSIGHIGITGGEPLLYPKIITKILEFDFSRDVTIQLNQTVFGEEI